MANKFFGTVRSVARGDETHDQFLQRTQGADTHGVPEWVHRGHYADDTLGLRIALANFRKQKATLKEKAAVAAYLTATKKPTFACSRCNKHAFPEPTVCFTCRRTS